MNLIELFNSLETPENERNSFNAVIIPDFPNFRIGIDYEGNPVLLLSVSKRIKDLSLKNFRLKYLQLEQNLECKIFDNGSFKIQTLTALTFRCITPNLQEYFLMISESLVKTIGQNPTQQKVTEALKKFMEVFKTLAESPTNTVNGLWAELFVIETSNQPKVLLDYWHNIPEEKFDFNAGYERIEVKSSSNFERKHIFSAEQLNPPSDSRVLIASIFLKQNSSGLNIQQLMDNIIQKLGGDIIIVDKLISIVFRTLGSSFEHSISVRFDYEIARQSLQLYRTTDIDKIEVADIPSNVSEVKFKSDLSKIKPVDMQTFKEKQTLFGAI
jgi:hypothetical protein